MCTPQVISHPARRSLKTIEKEFVGLATRLSDYFPNLDLRFNLRNGSTTLRCLIPLENQVVVEVPLGSKQPDDTFHEAVFGIKVATQTFDA